MTRALCAVLAMTLAVAAAAKNADYVPKFYYSVIQGRVVERGSGSPVAGALVLVKWEATFGAHFTSTVCTWIAAARTDPDGRYRISADLTKMHAFNDIARIEMHGGTPTARVYAPGFEIWRNDINYDWDHALVKKSFSSSGPTVVPMTINAVAIRSTVDRHDRVRALFMLSQPEPTCETFADASAIKSFYGALADEAQSLAVSGYEKGLAEAIRDRAENMPGRAAKGMERWTVVERLARSGKPDVDSRDYHDKTALMRAAESGDVEGVRTALKAGENPNRSIFMGDGINGGYGPITLAIEKMSSPPSPGTAPVGREQHIEVLRVLLADSATRIDYQPNPDAYTALMYAVSRVQPDVVELLLAAGADPNISTRHTNAMRLAEERMSFLAPPEKAVRSYELLVQSPRLDAKQKRSAANMAASVGDAARLKLLIAAGVDLNAGTFGTYTPLICATQHAILNRQFDRYVEAVRVIAAAKGLDKSVAHEGKTALQMAQSAFRFDLVEILR